jgi:hypothetical protein
VGRRKRPSWRRPERQLDLAIALGLSEQLLNSVTHKVARRNANALGQRLKPSVLIMIKKNVKS